MTTVYQKPNHSGPGTHVLAVGVGKYPHLIGGSGPIAAKPLGLGQLTSPPISTCALLNWFMAPLSKGEAVGFSNSSAPLASLEAVISAVDPISISSPAGNLEIEPAAMTKIENAFDLWLSRLRADDNNVGVFYFCGHGVMVADHYLLAEDFAQSNNKPWANAFDISNTFRAVQREVKGPLYFFVDACRQISRDKAFTLGADPQAIKAVDLNKALICSSSSLIEASGEGKLAFAIEGKVSRFTDALLTAMSGYCGIRSPGTTTWAVDGETLAAAIRKLLESSSKSAAQRQVSDQFISGSSVPLLQLTSVPRVKVELDLLPEAMRALALIYLQSSKGDRFEHDGTKGVFQTEVPRGFYDLGARSASGVFSELTYSDQELVPPLFGLTMQVQS